jgi:hypothetical protein
MQLITNFKEDHDPNNSKDTKIMYEKTGMVTEILETIY